MSNVPLIGISSHNPMYLGASESRFCLTKVMSKSAIVRSQDTLVSLVSFDISVLLSNNVFSSMPTFSLRV